MTPSNPMPPFGKEMREKEFMLANTYIPLNHGSYGTYPISVHKAKLKWQEVAEARPDHFMRKTYIHQLNKCRGIVAKEINADRRDCVFVSNATTGVNEVLHSLDWKPGDVLLCYSSAYGTPP
jgi:selenocysteine lyase/cysteine desulfurase